MKKTFYKKDSVKDQHLQYFVRLLEKDKMRIILLLAFFLVCITSCSEKIETDDYRLEFVGIYDCYKETFGPYPSPEIEIVVRIDSSSSDKIYVGEELVPIDENGIYGPGEIRPLHHYELRLQNDSIYLRTYQIIINGIVAPCTIHGIKRD